MQITKRILILSGIAENNTANPFLELLYVPEGRVNVKFEEAEVHVRSGGLTLIAPDEQHSAVSIGKSIVLKVLFDLTETETGNSFRPLKFERELLLENDADLRRAVSLLKAIMREAAEPDRVLRLKLLYYSLFDLIAQNCLMRTEAERDGRLKEILSEITQGGESVPLSEYARRLHLSESAFSRLFLRETGLSFSEYLSDLKTGRVAKLLWGTDESVTQIAEKAGFGSSTVMQRHFRKKYGCTPTEYRRRRDDPGSGTVVRTDELRKILARMDDENAGDAAAIRITVRGSIDRRMPKGEMQGINFGDARWLLDGDIREQLAEVPQILGSKYIAAGNLFDPYFRIRHGHAVSHLHFERLDHALDQILAISCVPVLLLPESRTVTVREIGVHVSDRASDAQKSGDDRIFEDPVEWETVFRSFLIHVRERHTYPVVRDWVFVFGHAPYMDSPEDCALFLEIYRRGYHLIRKYIPGATIWADSLNSSVLPELLKEDLLTWKREAILPDALNLMIYPYRVNARKKGDSDWDFSLLRIDADLHFILEELCAYEKIADECGVGDLPLVVSEWNTSLSERNPYNDSCAKACHMLQQMTDASDKTGLMLYRGFSDLVVSGYEEADPLIGAAALITRDGIKKPSSYAFEFWGRLGSEVISRGENHIVTTNHGAAYQILLFHPTIMSEEYKLIPESEHRMDELMPETENESRLRFEICFPEIREKKRMRVYHMSDQEGAVYTEWQKIGSPSQISPSELRYLKARSIPSLVVRTMRPGDQGITIEAELEANAFSLILLE